MWIVQENARARATTVYCGSDSLPFNDLRTLPNKMFENGVDLTAVLNSDADSHTLHREGPVNLMSYDMWAKEAGVRFASGPEEQAQSLRGRISSDITVIPWPSLLLLLVLHRARQSTDPRDKVYALIGISSSQWDSKLAIDYCLTTEQVYTEVAQYVIESTESLEILAFCELSKVGSHTTGLPSWVPDWRKRNWNDETIQSREPKFQAAGSSKAQAVVSDCGSVLFARGYQIGTVKYLGTPYHYGSSNEHLPKILDTFHDWWNLFRKIKGNDWVQQISFIKTLIWDFYEEKEGARRPSAFELEERYAAALGAFGNLSERLLISSLDPELGEFAKAFRSYIARYADKDYDRYWVLSIAEMMMGKRFFIGSGSEAFQAPMGLASAQIKEGDAICILFGCPLPVILQEVSSSGKFVLVGPVYLDGLMDGEALEILTDHPVSEIGSWSII
jgi:hypothetical protein